ncbi:hypothetical protein ACFY2R_29400 [Micromonospora olivasterospora]|uniref:Abortive infection protein n=1 Tax=Micromonospora olivasterospora TaxID=1880 RepID=A0A562IH68_MICOL|nr:abortive infection protein [Micromonospora olivasterospora]TWH70242.1 hypothetical protein JD77_05263 [Micromonospora olivasterospora]
MPTLGMNYDVGSYLLPDRPSRPDFDPAAARTEIDTIVGTLGCTALRISGDDPARLEAAARLALDRGLTVYLSPVRHNLHPDQALAYLADTARLAADLRRHGDVVFVAGLEASFFLRGFLLGDTPLDRIRTAMLPWRLMWSTVRLGSFHRRLNAYLHSAAATVRAEFDGPVTYASGPWEEVDWTPFDLVGVNLYRDRRNRGRYRELLRGYAGHGKPLVLTEFGCAAYQGAPGLGATAWTIADRSAIPPRLTRPVVRDERVQADELRDLLEIYQSEPVSAAFVFTWAQYTYPHVDVPEHDLDTAGYGIIAVAADGSWRPKAAFDMLAARAARAGGEQV